MKSPKSAISASLLKTAQHASRYRSPPRSGPTATPERPGQPGYLGESLGDSRRLAPHVTALAMLVGGLNRHLDTVEVGGMGRCPSRRTGSWPNPGHLESI